MDLNAGFLTLNSVLPISLPELVAGNSFVETEVMEFIMGLGEREEGKI